MINIYIHKHKHKQYRSQVRESILILKCVCGVCELCDGVFSVGTPATGTLSQVDTGESLYRRARYSLETFLSVGNEGCNEADNKSFRLHIYIINTQE